MRRGVNPATTSLSNGSDKGASAPCVMHRLHLCLRSHEEGFKTPSMSPQVRGAVQGMNEGHGREWGGPERRAIP